EAELAHGDGGRQRLLSFVIVGGGATGVEMAGAIAEIARQTLAKDFRRIDPRSSRIILLEAGPRVLPTLPEDLSAYAQRTLMRMGGDLRASPRVTNFDRRGAHPAPGRLHATPLTWAPGVLASPARPRAGFGRPGAGPPRSFGPVPSGGVRDRRRGCGPRRKGGDGSGYRPGRQANGPLCRPAHRGGRGEKIFACAVSLSADGRARHH